MLQVSGTGEPMDLAPGKRRKTKSRKNSTEMAGGIQRGLWTSALCIHGEGPDSDSSTLHVREEVFVLRKDELNHLGCNADNVLSSASQKCACKSTNE